MARAGAASLKRFSGNRQVLEKARLACREGGVPGGSIYATLFARGDTNNTFIQGERARGVEIAV